jgi:phospholipid transport system transporter-binding protein
MRIEDAVAFPEGCLTLNEAGSILREGTSAMTEGVTVIDLASVTQVDSSALSLILSWRREAQRLSHPLSFRNIPDSLLSLTRLYGLDDLIH